MRQRNEIVKFLDFIQIRRYQEENDFSKSLNPTFLTFHVTLIPKDQFLKQDEKVS